MNNYRNMLLALPLIILCHLSSNSDQTITKAQVKPKADYVFSSAKLGESYQDRQKPQQEAMKLTYGSLSSRRNLPFVNM
ncbi:hypothetical protein PAND9192_01656 [Photobacterium andalusiense]|uniref:Uncharacterized protein n=1 Tax=Photobacterium andalusiense TaxID=2204296 RepID=A0A1Y6MGR7_9GAMM|nr:hypothetical protein PAND9192_01656 [Photobacterium andalusiense]